jgi:hypothetical protein
MKRQPRRAVNIIGTNECPVKIVVLFRTIPARVHGSLPSMDSLEQLWTELMSGDPRRIVAAWDGLTDQEQAAVREHLTRMRDQAGWNASQRAAAVAALEVLRDRTE